MHSLTPLAFAGKLRAALMVRSVQGSLVDFPGCVGGGCFRALLTNTEVRDIDVFYNNSNLFAQWKDYWNFQNPQHRVEKDEDCPGLWNLQRPGFPLIQFIGFHPFSNERDLAETFDWRCCAMTFNFQTGAFYYVDGAIGDCVTKVLVPQLQHTPERMEKRIAKYATYGFRKCENFDRILPTLPTYSGGYPVASEVIAAVILDLTQALKAVG